MSSSRRKDEPVDSVRAHAGLPSPAASAALASASAGVLAGGVVGAFAGPMGIIAGSVIGAVTGAAAGVALDDHTSRARRRDRKLDEAIGVIGGDLGAAREGAPPSRRGAFSSSSLGIGGGGATQEDAPDEGPIPRGA